MPDELEGASKEALLYGLIAVTLVSVASMGGAVILPLAKGDSRRRWMHLFIAMAVGTLSADAIFHLIPEVMGAHSHSHEVGEAAPIPGGTTPVHAHHEHDHHHPVDHADHVQEHFRDNETQAVDEHDHKHHEARGRRVKRHAAHGHHHHEEEGLNPERVLLLKLLVLLSSVYILYFVELIAFSRSHNHTHDHHVGDSTPVGSKMPLGWDGESSGSIAAMPPATMQSNATLATSPIVCCGLRGPALIILFGDGVHNFIDGVAMGVSFATSIPVGIATSIAVICHELPHELGDLAVLLESGLSMTKAIVLNLLSALTAYAGFFVGVFAVSIDSFQAWLLALTAGMFLYVAWIDMIAHLKHEAAERRDPWYLTCTLQFLGFAAGTMIMFLIAWFEDDLFGA